MKTTILKQSLLLLSSATLLAACGGDGGDSPIDDGGANPGESGNQSLLYSYPDDGQSEIATRAPIVLRFSSRVSTNAAEQNIILRREADGTELGFSAEEVPGERRGVVLQPDEELDPHTRYVIDVQGLPLARGPSADREIEFSTRALQRGPKNLVTTDSDFKLSRTFPSGGEQEPVMDFSTFRFQFTQPIDPATARYGQGGDATVTLTDSEGNLIDAALLVDGPYMTVDPEPEHLDTKTEYTLTLGSGLSSTFEQDFTGDNGVITFTPKDSSPRGEPTIMVQRITEAVKPSGEPNRSELTGAPVNEVPVNSTLLGEDSATRSSGDVRAELADVTQYTEVTPVRIPRSTILTGTNIDVMIGGEVPAGISSGAVKMHFLSDATGYLVPNPYADNRDDALRIVRLFMDVAISTENAQANGGFTQDILHIELIGTAEVDPQAGVLNLDAVSVVEPDVLGQEFAYGLLSFQLQSYKDQTNPPADFADTTPPTLQSWTLADNSAEGGPDKSRMAKPGDPIILNFSEPLDRESVEGKVTLYRTDNSGVLEQDIDYYMDGAALVVKPEEPLRYSEELNPISYELQLGSGITDLAGNVFVQGFDKEFQLAQKVRRWQPIDYSATGEEVARAEQDVEMRSPFILGLYPGFPCVLDDTTTDLENGIAGMCLGGIEENPDGKEPNDLITVSKMPANRPIIVAFSKDMKGSSFSLGGSFKVEKINKQGGLIGEVTGSLEVNSREIIFWPDVPWEEGSLYRYTLLSNGSVNTSAVDCNVSICGENGLPLQTQLLANIKIEAPNYNAQIPQESGLALTYKASPQDHIDYFNQGGGPIIKQYFVAEERTDNVLQMLRTSPIADINANLKNDHKRVIEEEYESRLNGVGWGLNKPTSSRYNPSAAIDGFFDTEESGPTSVPDTTTDGLTDLDNLGFGMPLDPNGLKPSANSAKILSTRFGIADPDTDWPYSAINGTQNVGANVGCGYTAWEGVGEPTCYFGICVYSRFQGIPNECPEEKFTYLNGVLFAEVTNRTDSSGSLLVHIYPGKIVTTSFLTVARGGVGENSSVPIESGYQVMRMRFTKEDSDAVRSEPITARIDDNGGEAFLSASVDLYLDAPYLWRNIQEATKTTQGADHNFFSYPVSINLTGPITFLDDGRMKIKQINQEPVHLRLRGNVPATYIDLKIPAQGSHLQYISTPIKN